MALPEPELPGQPADEEIDLGILCPNCAFSNVADADFCARCAAPLSMMATIDPFKQTLSEGFAYRKAVDGQSKPIVVVGIWLIFLPMMALPVFQAVNEEIQSPLEICWLAVLSTVCVVILYRTTAGFLSKRRDEGSRPPEE